MHWPDGERIAALEQRVTDLERRVADHFRQAEQRSNRIREVEVAVKLLLEAHKIARQAEQRQYARLTLVIAAAGVLLTIGLLAVAVVSFVRPH